VTLDEAKTIAKVLSGIDGGCSVCAADAAREMAEPFPDHPWFELLAVHFPNEDAASLADLAGIHLH
jgi:hypothetical protein